MTPWERFEASACLEPVDFVQSYFSLRGETYRSEVEFNPIERYPEAIYLINAGGYGVAPSLFGAKLDKRSSKAYENYGVLIAIGYASGGGLVFVVQVILAVVRYLCSGVRYPFLYTLQPAPSVFTHSVYRPIL